MNYNLVIYDDNEKLRQTLELLLEASGFNVKGSYSHCDDVIKNIQNQGIDLVIMDINMPGIGGIKGLQKLKEDFPDVKVVMHTVFDDDERIFQCICSGAEGYLLKNTNPIKFIQLLQETMEGGASMSPFIAQRVLGHFRESKKIKDQFNLTARELEILSWLVKGYSYKMIANECSITIDTVKKHLQNIYHKLHVNCATEAVAKALVHKIIQLD